MEKNPKPTRKTLPVPGWLLVVFMVLYCEVLLHLWITETVQPLRS